MESPSPKALLSKLLGVLRFTTIAAVRDLDLLYPDLVAPSVVAVDLALGASLVADAPNPQS